MPRLTIGLPTYNGARYLASTLRSLLVQDLDDFELVVSDNGSTDGTEEICRDVERGDARVRYLRVAENRGAAWNYNRVLELARSPLFKWAADDDKCEPSFVRRCVEQLDAHPGAIVAFPQTILIGPDDRPIGSLDDSDLDLREDDPVDRLRKLLSHRVEWHPVFGVIRTDVLRGTRGIGAFVLADVALLAELCLRGAFHQIPEQLFLRRYHEERSIAANPGFKDHAAWYDPANRSRSFVLPNARLVRELLVRVAEAPLPAHRKVQAGATVLRYWALPHWRHIGGEIKLAAAGAIRHSPR